MSELEHQFAKPSLQGLIVSKNPVALSATQVTSISAFMFKSAVIADHMNRDAPPFFTPSNRRRFRRSLMIPSGVSIWIGCLDIPTHSRGIFRGLYYNPPVNTVNQFELYSFTWGIGKVVLQLACLKWRKARLRRDVSGGLNQPIAWDDYATPIWPDSKPPIAWPPAHHITGDLLDTFAHRWRRVKIPSNPL